MPRDVVPGQSSCAAAPMSAADLAALYAHARALDDRLRQAFDNFDLDGSGTMGMEEVLPLLDDLGELKKLSTAARVAFATEKFIEADANVAEVAVRNAAQVAADAEVVVTSVGASADLGHVDRSVLISNPPWGVQTAGADRPVLDAMFSSKAAVIHLMHHAEAGHVEALAASHGWVSEDVLRAPFRLPLVHDHQRSGRRTTEVLCRRFSRPASEERIEKERP